MLDRRGRETYVEVGDGPESEGVRDGLMRTSQDSSGRLTVGSNQNQNSAVNLMSQMVLQRSLFPEGSIRNCLHEVCVCVLERWTCLS